MGAVGPSLHHTRHSPWGDSQPGAWRSNDAMDSLDGPRLLHPYLCIFFPAFWGPTGAD
jgi:hypothetical protein